jgi:hypothetical protein
MPNKIPSDSDRESLSALIARKYNGTKGASKKEKNGTVSELNHVIFTTIGTFAVNIWAKYFRSPSTPPRNHRTL